MVLLGGYDKFPHPMTFTNVRRNIGRSKGGARDVRPPGVQILSFPCSFQPKIYKIIALLGVGAPPLRKILDPPLRNAVDSNLSTQLLDSSWMDGKEKYKLIKGKVKTLADPGFPRGGVANPPGVVR